MFQRVKCPSKSPTKMLELKLLIHCRLIFWVRVLDRESRLRSEWKGWKRMDAHADSATYTVVAIFDSVVMSMLKHILANERTDWALKLTVLCIIAVNTWNWKWNIYEPYGTMVQELNHLDELKPIKFSTNQSRCSTRFWQVSVRRSDWAPEPWFHKVYIYVLFSVSAPKISDKKA